MDVRARVRDRPAAVASLLALALVFGAVLGAVPDGSFPRAPALLDAVPQFDAAISLGAAATIAAGVRAVGRGEVARHRAPMLATTALFALFPVRYPYGIVARGPAAFPGPRLRDGLPSALPARPRRRLRAAGRYALALALSLARPVAELPATPHPTVGWAAATLWLVPFGLGPVVYGLLYLR